MRRGGRQERGGGGSQLKPIASLSCLRCCGPRSSSGSHWPVTLAGSWCRFWIAASVCVLCVMYVCVQDGVCVFVQVKRKGAGGTSVSDPPECLALRTWRCWRACGGPRRRGEGEDRASEQSHAHSMCWVQRGVMWPVFTATFSSSSSCRLLQVHIFRESAGTRICDTVN